MRAPARWGLATLHSAAVARAAVARGAVGTALAERGRVAAERDAAREALGRHREIAAEAVRRGAGPAPTGAVLATRALHAARLAGEEARLVAALRRREGAVAAAEAEVLRRREVLGGARAEVEALERRREGWRAARNRDRARAEEDAVDEAVSARRGGEC